LKPGIIFEKAINLKVGKVKSVHHMIENQNLAINSAKAIGCNVINIGAQVKVSSAPTRLLGLSLTAVDSEAPSR
jgi:plastin-1